MWSRSAKEARPVRIVAISCWRSARAFSIRVFTCDSTSFRLLNTVPPEAACCSVFIDTIIPLNDYTCLSILMGYGWPETRAQRLVNDCAHVLPHRNPHDIPRRGEVENQDGKLIVAAHRN